MTKRHGFTLVEMIVALAVTAVLAVLMLQMFMTSSALWKQNDERLETFREARAALQLMARDLGAVNAVGMVPADYPILALEPHAETTPEDRVNQEIYILSSASNRGSSDLCAIGYFCGWDDTHQTFLLRRQFADSDTTFSRLKTTLKVDGAMTASAAFKNLFSRSVNPAAGSEEPMQDIATYVWDLQFAIPNPTNSQLPGPAWPQHYFGRELPEWVEIRFKALGTSAARKLEGQALGRKTWFDPQSDAYRRLILPNEQQFVTRVKLSR